MQLSLTRRWGTRQAGETVEVDDVTGEWLIGIGHAVRPGQEEQAGAVGTGRVHPGGDGPDPAAGGDPTRSRMRSEVKSRRDGDLSGRVTGAPRASGDVTHVAPENLGKEHQGDGGDVLLASGKTLTVELADQQAELDAAEKKRSSKRGDQGGSEKAAAKGGLQASDESPQGEGRKLTQPKK